MGTQTCGVAGNWMEDKLKQEFVAFAQTMVVNRRMGLCVALIIYNLIKKTISYSSIVNIVHSSLYMVCEQLNFSRMGLSTQCPNPSYPGGPMFSVGVVSLS